MADELILDDVIVTAPRHSNATTSDSAASAPKLPPVSPPPARPNPAAPPGDALTLIVGDQRLQGWLDVHLTRGIEVFPSHFVLRVTERTPGQPSKVSVDPGATCKVLIGSDLVLTGYVDTYASAVSPRGHTITVVGRSQTEDLVDCAAGVKEGQETKATMTFSSPTLLLLAQDLCQPFGITVTEPDGEGTPLVSIGDGIPQFSIQLGQTVYDVLEPIARWKQMLMLDGTDGNLVLAKVGTKRAGSGFAMPGNVEEAKVGFRKQDRFTVYLPAQFSFDNAFEVQPSAGGSGNFYQVVPDGAAFQGQSRLDGKARYRPHFVVSEQNLGGIYLAEFRAKWEKARRYGRSQAVTLTVSTWRDRKGDLWAPNTLATVDLPALKLANLTWLITEVTFLRGSSGTRATVTLMPPEAFTPEPSFLTAFDPQIAQAQGDALRSSRQVLTDSSRSVTNPGAGANGNPRAGDAPGV